MTWTVDATVNAGDRRSSCRARVPASDPGPAIPSAGGDGRDATLSLRAFGYACRSRRLAM
jgi:hypothetical protein